MKEFEYMKILYVEIPDDVIEHYKLHHLVHTDGYVYIEIQKGMPGLKQAGKLQTIVSANIFQSMAISRVNAPPPYGNIKPATLLLPL